MPISAEDLDNRFNYHRPDDTKARNHELIRTELRKMAAIIVNLTPEGREQSLAITHLEDAMMWANAAIARH